MSAAAHNAGVGVLARGHAITAAISRIRPRGTRADLARAFFSHVFQHSLRHDGMTSDVTAPRVSKRLCVYSSACSRAALRRILRSSLSLAMTNDKRNMENK